MATERQKKTAQKNDKRLGNKNDSKDNMEITSKQEIFCQEWVDTIGNATQAALLAFDIEGKEILDQEPPEPIDKDKPTITEVKAIRDYWDKVRLVKRVAASVGSEYLRKPNIRQRIDKILDDREFNDEGIKREHFRLIKGAKSEVAIRGVDMYYKLKGKYAPDKKEVSGIGGKPIEYKDINTEKLLKKVDDYEERFKKEILSDLSTGD